MANAGHIAKISVEKHDSKEQFLYDLDKSKSLCEVIVDICKTSGLPQSKVYGLKLIRTNDDPTINCYISEKNYKNIKHSDCLKIVFSIKFLLENRILPNVDEAKSDPKRNICYEDLSKLAADPVFIEELVESGSHQRLINTFIKDDSLDDNEIRALVLTICHLLRKNSIADTSRDFLTRSIQLTKTDVKIPPDYVQYVLSVLQKILVQRDLQFREWKERIIKEVPIKSLIPYIRHKNERNLQYTVVLLINTVIKLCRGEKKKQLIGEMSETRNRDRIFKYIIEPGNLDKNMEHELYVMQTLLLSVHNEALQKEVNLNDKSAFDKEDFELPENDVRRLTILMDFDERETSSSRNSLELFSNHNASERLSIVSLLSDKSYQSTFSRRNSCECDYDNFTLNCLTVEVLKHFKNNHNKYFLQSQIEEKVYEPGIFITSERVVAMLAEMLHISAESPDAKSVLYQPIVFNSTSSQPFFHELFARSMWLLSKTRREMKVSTIEDYPKAMKVLRKQIKMVLDKKPMNIKQLTSDMKETTFEAVLKRWQIENDERLNDMLENNNSIKVLKEKFSEENYKYVRENRVNTLKAGGFFPKISEKFQRTNRQMFVQLSRNERELYLFDAADMKVGEKVDSLKISDMTHIAEKKNCKHWNLCKNPNLVFSIIFNYSEKQVNFIAENEKTAAHWLDGFNILAGELRDEKKSEKMLLDPAKRSQYFKDELDVLVEMDVRLQVIELQNVTLSNSPPPIPPLPKPLLPPKPEMLRPHRKTSKIK